MMQRLLKIAAFIDRHGAVLFLLIAAFLLGQISLFTEIIELFDDLDKSGFSLCVK